MGPVPAHLFRFFGPIPKTEAEDLADNMLCGPELVEDLTKFFTGEIEPKDIVYRIQVIAEDITSRRYKGSGAV